MTYEDLMNLSQQVSDEKSFVRFLAVLRENCESTSHRCESSYDSCYQENHFQSQSTKNYLLSMEEWAGGDFVEGLHGGDPILRRVATMLLVGKYLRSQDQPR